MNDTKRHLKVVKTGNVVPGVTCYAAHAQYEVSCQRTACQHWIKSPDNKNCVIIAAKNGSHTLEEIGLMYDLTRMRICQIEKSIIQKIRAVGLK